MSVDLVAAAIVLLLLCLPLPLILLLINEMSKQRCKPQMHPVRSTHPSYPSYPANPPLNFTAPHPLKSQLLSMVGGHHPTADRLLTQVVRDNPGRPLDWYYDRVIQDLIRDRR
ncbi:hypothetical protein [Egbenema bharatensis]|uniref:hypothetical protein n=1 Tax=Egbenema bharatensis TaxID=3463334 RepID=UPI003A870D2D